MYAIKDLESEAVAAVTGAAGGRGRVGLEGGRSALTWTFGAPAERTRVQSSCRRSRERAGEGGVWGEVGARDVQEGAADRMRGEKNRNLEASTHGRAGENQNQ
jgi:hypothetical protein